MTSIWHHIACRFRRSTKRAIRMMNIPRVGMWVLQVGERSSGRSSKRLMLQYGSLKVRTLPFVIPAQAGIQCRAYVALPLDSRLRGNDGERMRIQRRRDTFGTWLRYLRTVAPDLLSEPYWLMPRSVMAVGRIAIVVTLPWLTSCVGWSLWCGVRRSITWRLRRHVPVNSRTGSAPGV